MALSVPWKCKDCKLVGNFSPYSSLWLPCFSVANMPKAQWDRREIWMQSWRFLLYMVKDLSFTVRISTNQRNSILVYFVDCLCHALQTLAWLSNYHISMIFFNILSLGSFFLVFRLLPTSNFWHTLVSITLTP